jgi:hypothetical protein
MEKLAQPSPFHYIYHHVQSCGVRSSREGRYTPPIPTLPLYVLCAVHTALRIEWQNFEYPEKQLGKNLRKTFIWVDFTDVVPRYHARVVYVYF